MNIKIFPSQVSGAITAPPSKSVTHRTIILAALANGTSHLKNILLSDDTKYTIKGLLSLGVIIKQKGNDLIVHGTGGKLTAPNKPIFLGNSGSSMRMLTAVAVLADGTTTLTGEKRLCQRPIGELLTAIRSLGVNARSQENNDCPPVVVKGSKINGGIITISGSVSQQYITALLLIAPFAKNSLTIKIDKNQKSRPYIAITIDLMKTFGVNVENDNFQTIRVQSNQTYNAQTYTVEGDYSSASYFFAAAAIAKGPVIVKNLRPDSKQGDKEFLPILESMGCDIKQHTDGFSVSRNNELSGIDVSMGDYPDIVQTFAVVAAFAKGKTTIRNIDHLRFKESDRLETTMIELKKMGIACSYENEILSIQGDNPHGAVIETHKDHRVAMSFAIAGLVAEGETIIKNAEVINKSYPNFFNDLKKIGARIEIV